MEEKLSQKQRLLNFLSDHQWHTREEITEAVYKLDDKCTSARAGARVWDLNHCGYKVEGKFVDEDRRVYAYRLVGIEPTPMGIELPIVAEMAAIKEAAKPHETVPQLTLI